MRRRITFCLGLLLGLCVLGNATAMLCLRRSVDQLAGLAERHRIESLRARLTSHGGRVEADTAARLAGLELSDERFGRDLKGLEEALGVCDTCHHAPGVRQELDRLGGTFRAYRAAMAGLGGKGGPGHSPASAAELLGLARRLTEQAAAMDARAARHLAARSEQVTASVRHAWFALSATLVAVLGFGSVVAYHLKGRLTRPVEALLAGIARVREGDLSYRVEAGGDEEFRALGAALNRAHQTLKQAQESALQAEKLAAVGRLAAGVAHEIGNPLASISSIAQVMRRHCDGDSQAERINSLMEQVERISRVVHDLLSFSRPPGSEQFKPVELGALLERATGLLAYDKRAGQVRIVRRYGERPCVVRGDADRLLLVFTNIIINAFDALHGVGRGTLTISADRQGDLVVIGFADDGPGMSAEQLAHAFEPFFTTKEPGSGTGLGLWICYQVIRRHAGNIRIDSRPGAGTQVTITLPAEPAAPSGGPGAAAAQAGRGGP